MIDDIGIQMILRWFTHSGNPQRTGWQKDENTITKEKVKDFNYSGSSSLTTNTKRSTRSSNSCNMITNRGFKELAIIAGSSDNLRAIDTDLGKVLSKTSPAKNSTWLCTGGLTATPFIPYCSGKEER
jgi:hypothetical protein